MPAIEQLLDIMRRLRDPQQGCPWDRKQTYQTIVPYTLEEAYEVADAIARGDMDELRDELGDLLFQVVFYSQIAAEEGHFDFDRVAQSICDKMIRRHPHVFADEDFTDDAQLRHAWEAAKSVERAAKNAQGRGSQLDGVARALPALIRAEKLQKRAARVGFDWPDVQGAMDKVREELREVEEVMVEGDADRLEDELGDMLFSLVNVVRKQGHAAEQALSRANEKFERRFRQLELLLAAEGMADVSRLDADTLDSAWERVKAKEKQAPS